MPLEDGGGRPSGAFRLDRNSSGGADAAPAAPEGGAAVKDSREAMWEEQARARAGALAWVGQYIGGMLLVPRLVTGPITDAIDEYLSIAGVRWQAAEVPRGHGRRWRVD